MKKIFFTKMQSLGNDFVVLDWEEYQEIGLPMDEVVKKMCARNFGVGADGLIVVVPESDKADLGWMFYNMDGAVAKINGNAIRCFAKYALNKGYVDKEEFSVETEAGIICTKINPDGTIMLNLSDLKEVVTNEVCVTDTAEFSFEGVFFYK